jgi:hypothetical protein
MPRLPRAYQGIDHETLGSDVLSLLDSVLMPEQLLGAEVVSALRTLRHDGWYPIATLLEPLERLDKVLGPSSLRRVGWSIFKLSHEQELKRGTPSARDIVYGIDGMYHHANRGREIGGWQVVHFAPGEAHLEKTTPHHCVVEEGILEAAFRAIDVPAVIYQAACFRRGHEACRFVITSHVTGRKWTGEG